MRVFEGDLAEAVDRFSFPVRIIIRSKDKVATLKELRESTDRLADGKLIVYKGARYVACRYSPDRFQRDLLELCSAAQK